MSINFQLKSTELGSVESMFPILSQRDLIIVAFLTYLLHHTQKLKAKVSDNILKEDLKKSKIK